MKKTFKYTIITFLILVGTYALAVIVLPYYTIRAETVIAVKEINIYIKSNGVHSDIVVPIKNKYFDWSNKLKQKNTLKPSSKMKYIGMGWGDKGFYLNTPTWADLTFNTAANAAFGLSTTAMHTTYYKNVIENESCVMLKLTKNQYEELCKYIYSSYQLKNGKVINIKTNATYGDHDAFYEAKGVYSVFKTCNTWTNNALKKCGQKNCLWTVTDNQILIKNK